MTSIIWLTGNLKEAAPADIFFRKDLFMSIRAEIRPFEVEGHRAGKSLLSVFEKNEAEYSCGFAGMGLQERGRVYDRSEQVRQHHPEHEPRSSWYVKS